MAGHLPYQWTATLARTAKLTRSKHCDNASNQTQEPRKARDCKTQEAVPHLVHQPIAQGVRQDSWPGLAAAQTQPKLDEFSPAHSCRYADGPVTACGGGGGWGLDAVDNKSIVDMTYALKQGSDNPMPAAAPTAPATVDTITIPLTGWKAIPEFPAYEAHPDGYSRSWRSGGKTRRRTEALMLRVATDGRVTLLDDDGRMRRRSARLMMMRTHGTPKPANATRVTTVDRNIRNVRLDNLIWI